MYCTLNITVRVLSLQSSVIYGFVKEPWHSRHVLFPSEHVASSVLEPCALSSVSCWSVVFGFPALMSWVLVSCRGFGHSRSVFCLVEWSCGLSCPHVLCFVLLHAVHVLIGCVHSCYVLLLCGKQLVFFIGCVLSCCHVLFEHVAYEYSH